MTGSGNGGQGLSEGTDSEDAERCPICLGVLVRGDLAMPNSCCHVFCLGCLLTWAESQTVPSCPVDRRPFDSIYKWDRALGCVQIPVRRRTNQSENKKCFCRDPEPNPCLKSKQVARLRRQKPERASDTKSKGLVRKCSDEDPSSINRKKVRGTPCCTWSPSTFGSLLSSLTQDTVEPHWVPEDMSYESGYRQCKRQTQDCPWLTPAAPIAANGISRHSFHPSSWNHSPFPLRPFSSPFSSTTQFGPGHFVFQGRVCAVTCPKGGGVTCPKGGEKRGGRASGSKAASTKDAQPVASRRSGRRSSRGQEAAAPPAEESAASQPSQSSDSSDSSAGQPSKPAARVSQAAAKKKGKQVTNRKASGKRKAPAKKRKVSPQVLSSPAASEEEEEEEGGNKEEKEEEEDEVDEEKQISELQHSDVEASPKRDHNGSSPAHEEEATGAPPLSDGSSPEDEEDATRPLSDDAENERDDETREQSPAAREEKNGSSMSSSPANSCQMSPVGDQSEIAEERPDSPVPSEDNGSEPYSPVPSEEKGSEHPDSPVPSEENGSEPDSPVPSEEKGSEPDSPVPSEENGSEHPDSPVRSEEKGSEPDSPVPSEEKGSDGVPSPLPSNSHNGPAESPQSPHSGQEAEDDAMEVCADSPEGNDEASMMKIEESGSSPHPTRDSQQKVHDAGDAEEDSKSRMPESQERPSDERAKEGSKEDNLSQDDTNVIPMDCSSPASDHGDNLIEPQSDDAADRPTGTVAPAPPPASQVAKEEAAGDKDNKEEAAGDKDNKGRRERERSPDRKNGKQRRSRFHSPSSTYKRDSGRQEASSRRSRSRSRERTQDRDGSPPSRRSSRGRSRDGERDKERNDSERDSDRDRERDRERDGGDRDRDHSRRERSRERRRRRSRSRSRSRSSRSRSGSRSRTRSHRRGGGAGGPSPNRRSPSEDRSPQRKERGSRGGGGGSWRSAQPGSDSSRRNPPSSDHLPARGGGAGTGGGRFENGAFADPSPDPPAWSSNDPDWVTEKTKNDEERNRNMVGGRWEDQRRGGSWGGSERGRGGGGGPNRSFYSQQGDTAGGGGDRWQPRNNFSGNSGNDAYSRFNENRGGGGGRRKEHSDQGDSVLDRSGWSSTSSWAVRRTLPADVQDYYSRRERGGRGGGGGWNRLDEEQTAAADPPKTEPVAQALPGNAPVPAVLNVMPSSHQPPLLHHPYPVAGGGGGRGAPLQPAAPYAMAPQVPSMHLHPAAVPLLQGPPGAGAQGLPPPPPPPPPMQQGSQMSTQQAHPDRETIQMASSLASYGKPPLLPTPTKAAAVPTGHQGGLRPSSASQALPSSTTQPAHHGQQHKAPQADSSKLEKRQQIQERAVNEVKNAMKPYYQKKEITKDEYKEIVRKAVEKVCHSKSGEVNSSKVANLVKAYVDKYKHARKK